MAPWILNSSGALNLGRHPLFFSPLACGILVSFSVRDGHLGWEPRGKYLDYISTTWGCVTSDLSRLRFDGNSLKNCFSIRHMSQPSGVITPLMLTSKQSKIYSRAIPHVGGNVSVFKRWGWGLHFLAHLPLVSCFLLLLNSHLLPCSSPPGLFLPFYFSMNSYTEDNFAFNFLPLLFYPRQCA